MSDQIIVAGFHRSGTSLTAQLLHQAGLFLGERLVGANASNPFGHFEDWDFVELHEQILADNGLTWVIDCPIVPYIGGQRWQRARQIVEGRNASRRLWGFKDPRACMFLPVWKYLMPDAKVLIVYRHFRDCTYSLGQRHSRDLFAGRGDQHLHRRFWSEPDLALRMWLVHNKELLQFARAHPEDVMAISMRTMRDGFPLVKALNSRWGLGMREVDVAEVFDPSVTACRTGRQPVSDRSWIPEVERVWEELESLERATEAMIEEGKLAG